MEDPTRIVPVPQKRPREEDAEPQPSTPVKVTSSQASTPLSVLSNVQTPSPMRTLVSASTVAHDVERNCILSISAPTNSTAASQSSPQIVPDSSSTQQPAKKKRKALTQQEKDDTAREKEAKAKAKADKAARKEIEAKLKADEKALKAAQKEAESKVKAEEKTKKEEERAKKEEEKAKKEAEKAKKEAEKREREEEKAKKERSQMKLNAFFVKPKVTASSAESSLVDSNSDSTVRPTSLLTDTSGAVTNAIPSPQKPAQKNALSEYDRCFLPFALPSHAILAPTNAFMEDADKLNAARARLDQLSRDDCAGLEPITLQTLKVLLPTRARRGLKTATITDVVKRVHGLPDQPVGLTNDNDANQQQPLDMLKEMPMKYLHFGEDVRPPYYGTYTKSYPDATARKIARNPICRARQDTNYDYDSEAEWEEPEEGEDLDSEGEDDAEEEGEDDLDGFLDDEEDPQLKRRMLSGDLVPVSTGLCWEDANGISKLSINSDSACIELKEFKMEYLLDPYPRSIDPFSSAYWTPPEPVAAATATMTNKVTATSGLMNPPLLLPLPQRTINGLLNTLNSSPSSTSLAASKSAASKKMVPDDQLPAFKAEIQGKDLTKIGMIEALKKAFPKLPKAAIANTLNTVAARVGPTEREKRWVLINN